MTDRKWTEEEFIARCRTIYRMGNARPDLFILMQRWLDAVMRYEHTMFSYGQSQGRSWLDFLDIERGRVDPNRTLAGDVDGYALQQIAAVFAHHCQKCAEDPQAWHTRPAFCDHKKTEAFP